MSPADLDLNREKREFVAGAVGFRPPSGAFRKDHLNAILDYLGGDALTAREVYGEESPRKEWFYERVAEEAGFDYEPGDGENARPFNSGELDDLVAAVEDVLDSATAI